MTNCRLVVVERRPGEWFVESHVEGDPLPPLALGPFDTERDARRTADIVAVDVAKQLNVLGYEEDES